MDKEWIMWAFNFVLLGMLSLLCWLGKQVWQDLRAIRERLNAYDVEQATIRAGRFTAIDWTTAKSIIDSQFQLHEKRIFKLEGNGEHIEESLARIETKLGTR